MEPFTYESLAQRVVFGTGTLATVGDELDRLGRKRALLVTTAGHAVKGQRLADDLGSRCVGHYAGAAVHTPVSVTNDAMAGVRELEIDAVIALGGGSAIGLGKAIAVRTDLPQIVIPTTYSGSEATPTLGETEHGRKTSRRDAKILPEVIIYDVALTLTLPVPITVVSGLNAMAHAVEALYAKDRNPITSALAERGMASLVTALPALVADPLDVGARSEALVGAWASGSCLAVVGMALHHKICHALGGSFDLPHAETHAVVLPHAVAYNERAVRQALLPVARVCGSATAADGLWTLARQLGAPTTLAQLGMKEAGLDRAVEVALQNPYWNPQPIIAADVRALLQNAFFGRPPGTIPLS